MRILRDEQVYKGKFLDLYRRIFVNSKGEEAVWEMVKRKTYGPIIIAAAVTPEKELILEKIFRIPVKDYVLELPAGLMDREGESEEEAVRRELLEETGYAVDEVKLLIRGPFNTGMQNDDIAIYLGVNAHKIQEPQLDDSEELEVVKVPLDGLLERLTNSKTVKVDIKIASILPFLDKIFGPK